ncbi:MAG: SDR family oxidoreductase [Cellulomonas sp.]
MRTIVVTGSASGIGRATKELLEQQGDRVIGVDLHDADVTVDLTTAEGRTALVERVRELSGGTIDAVIANAGLSHESPATIAVNYFGAVATLEGLRPMLSGSTAPHASLTSSMASLLPHDTALVELALAGDEAGALARCAEVIEAGQGALIYASSKNALSRWMRRVAATPEWAGAGIPLNGVGPGVVITPMTQRMLATEEARAALAQQVPMPLHGFMGPEAVASLHVWLISAENTHVCGQIVFVDGGSDVVIRGDSTW